ncbi:MAG TPA: DUF748 domain-containing protein [Immundisolibacter sp.]|nr:DUF748 domain-containing protein [Immundisolibacter sp.]
MTVPERARRYAEQTLAETTGGTARVAALDFDPLRLALRIDGLHLTDPEGALLLAVDSAMADLAVDSLWTRSVHLDALTIRGARGQLGLLEGGGISPQLPAGGGDGGPPPRLRIDRMNVDGSALVVRDASAQPAAALRLTDLVVSMASFDSQAAEPIPVLLRGRAGGGTLRLEADLVPAPLALEGSLSLQGLDAEPALAYLERALPLKARGGKIDAHAGLSLAAGGAVRLSDGHVSLRQSALADASDALLAQIAELAVDELALDLAARRVSVGWISGRDNWLALARAPDGRINLQDLTRQAGSDETDPAGPSWQVTLGALALTGQRLSISDETVQPALRQDLTLEQVDIGALGSPDKVPVSLTGSLADGGTFGLAGEAVLPAGPAELEITAKGLPLPPLAPYLPDVGPVALRSGTAAATGHLTLGGPGPEFRGQVTLSRVDLWDTERDEALLGLRTLRVDQLQASAQGVTSSKIWINRPVLRAVITENRQSNLSRFGPRDVAPVTDSPVTNDGPGPAPMRFAVDTVRVSRGTLHIEDHSLTPHFAVSIEQLKGDIDGLASDATQPARVALNGRIDQYAPATVEGSFTVGVPREAAFKLSFTGVEMATFTPYVSRFAGYRIERGTLDVDLDYTVSGPQVIGNNRIILNRLVLGERVDSPDALDLPLTLALAVLKDSRGVIDVALPLRGDLSNPQFDYGALIGKAIRALVVKAVKAPFTLLARLVGGKAKDLRTVAFAPGSAQLPAAQMEPLQKVAQALIARPQLTLHIHPLADQNDARALAQQALGAALGQAAGEDDDPLEGDVDWTERLIALYEERFGNEPPAVPAPADTQPTAAEQRAAAARAGRERLLAAMAPDTAALRALAQARGEAIRAALMDNGVPVGRLTIVLPAEDAPLQPSATSELVLAAS